MRLTERVILCPASRVIGNPWHAQGGGYGAIVEGFDLEAEPMISAAVGELERSAGEVRDADIHDEWLIGDIKRALECDIDLQLGRRYVQRQEKGHRCERETGQERASLKAKERLDRLLISEITLIMAYRWLFGNPGHHHSGVPTVSICDEWNGIPLFSSCRRE